jgi:hypothetical protein
MAGGEGELHEEEEVALPPPPTRELCAAYLLHDRRWRSKSGGNEYFESNGESGW